MRLAFVFLLVLLFFIGHILSPRDINESQQRAIDELDVYCFDMKIDCGNYEKKGLLSDDGKSRRFLWIDRTTNENLIITVPYSRFGDYWLGSSVDGVGISITNKIDYKNPRKDTHPAP